MTLPAAEVERVTGAIPVAADDAVVTTALTKRFGARAAVDGIDMVVPKGAVYGFLGPNGSGKTTTIRLLLGLVRPTSGSSALLGHPIPAEAGSALPRVGALVEGPAFHPYLSGRSNLARLDAADAWSDPRPSARRIDGALDRVGLLAAATKRYRAYSLGMRQRLAIASALLQPRELLVLDEPTNGLDPQGTREVRHLVASLAEDGATVLISSHLLSEVEQTVWEQDLTFKRYGHVIEESWSAFCEDPSDFLHFFGPSRFAATTWTDAGFDRDFIAANRLPDPAERLKALAACEAQLIKAMPVIPIFHDSWAYLEAPFLRGVRPNPFGLPRFKYASIDTNWRPA